MLKHNDEHTRQDFASGYKCFAIFNTVMFVLGMIGFTAFAIWVAVMGSKIEIPIIKKAGIYAAVGSIIACAIGLVLNIHFIRVVNAYAHPHCDEKSAEKSAEKGDCDEKTALKADGEKNGKKYDAM